MIKVMKLHEDAILPTVAHRGEDLGFDLYALEDTILSSFVPTKVRTGIAIETFPKQGMLFRDRSSMAARGTFVTGGVIDWGYRGELLVMMTNIKPPIYALKSDPWKNLSLTCTESVVSILKGDKIAQMLPYTIGTSQEIIEVTELKETQRGANGFGSSGR